ncbi:MAG: YchF-related putative GTPase [Thermoplasmata archaeon]|nr:YchF-related putative GTPase [Thermoplasmata archaeon]
MEVGVIGKPNVGKSTLFNALTLLDAGMAPYPFTTVTPNRGVGAVRVACPHPEKGTPCTAGNAACIDGVRWVLVKLLDVPGLVPGAHEGKGLGTQLVDDLRAADGFLQVVDLTGATNAEGMAAPPGTVDPAVEVRWVQEELIEWVLGILNRDFDRTARSLEMEEKKIEDFLAERFAGLSIGPARVASALRAVPLDRVKPTRWTKDERRRLVTALLDESKPRVVAANKCDRAELPARDRLVQVLAPIPVIATAAEAELTLRKASRAGLTEYRPGDATFRVKSPERLSPAQQTALEAIRGILTRWGSTGVQAALERMVYDQLHQIVVFPVEDEAHWTDSKGRVLPDALLVPAGTTARGLAYKVHSDLGENFVRAVDGRTHRALGAEHPLEHGAVVRIAAHK